MESTYRVFQTFLGVRIPELHSSTVLRLIKCCVNLLFYRRYDFTVSLCADQFPIFKFFCPIFYVLTFYRQSNYNWRKQAYENVQKLCSVARPPGANKTRIEVSPHHSS